MKARILCFISAGTFSVVALAAELKGKPFGFRQGYLSSIEEERSQTYEEVYLVPPPAKEKPFKEKIFNRKLTKEFMEKYEAKFGRTTGEQTISQTNAEFVSNSNIIQRESAIRENQSERQFGDYMTKRLIEYHVEDYAKNEPAVRPAWEAKERLSNVKLEVTEGYGVDIKYNLSGNQVDLLLKNPHVDSKITIEMDQNAFGPSTVEETTFRVGKQTTTTIYNEILYRITKETVTLVTKKELQTDFWITLSTEFFIAGNVNGPNDRVRASEAKQHRVIAGLSWVY